MVSVMGSKIGFFSSSAGHALSALALLVLIALTWFRSRRFTFNSLPANLKLSLIVLVIVTGLLGLFGLISPNVATQLKRLVVMKTAGILISIVALVSSCRIFSFKEISMALRVFAVFELAGCFAVFYLGSDINENAIAVRASVACMCLYALLPSKFMGIMAIIGCLAFSASLGCRTSSIALLSAVFFLYLEQNSRRQRTVVFLVSFTSIVLLLIFLPLITTALQRIAIAYLGSDNVIAHFFLHDKSSAKISYDYLDRFDVWSFAWEHIRNNLLLGHGLGTEHEIMHIRSHNAYLSLLFEGGIVFLLVWMWFYLRLIVGLFNRRWIAKVGESRLFYLALLLLSYMMLAGIVESSGLASVATPINLIFIFLSVWLCQPKRDYDNRRLTGAS